MQESKVCSKCHQFKMANEFSRNAIAKDGLRPDCKSCNKVYRNNRKLPLMTTKEHESWLKRTIKWILS